MKTHRNFLPARLIFVIATSVFATHAAAAQRQAGSPSGLPSDAASDSAIAGRERAAWAALQAQDTVTFARLLGDAVVDVDVSGARETSPQSVARFVTGCKTASYSLSDFRVRRTAETVVVTYQAAVVQTCWGQSAPSPLLVMTVYESRGSSWVPVAHSETPAAHWR